MVNPIVVRFWLGITANPNACPGPFCLGLCLFAAKRIKKRLWGGTFQRDDPFIFAPCSEGVLRMWYVYSRRGRR